MHIKTDISQLQTLQRMAKKGKRSTSEIAEVISKLFCISVHSYFTPIFRQLHLRLRSNKFVTTELCGLLSASKSSATTFSDVIQVFNFFNMMLHYSEKSQTWSKTKIAYRGGCNTHCTCVQDAATGLHDNHSLDSSTLINAYTLIMLLLQKWSNHGFYQWSRRKSLQVSNW